MSIEKLDFKKVTKENLPYTLILTKVIQNIKHIESLAIWAYLCSLPPDWKICKEHLKNHFQIGNSKLKAIFSYLKRAGLIDYFQERLENGLMGDHVIHVLCGDKFNENEPYFVTGGSVSNPPDSTGGSIYRRAVNRSSGSGLLQKKQKTKEIKKQKKEREQPLSPDFKINEETVLYVQQLEGLSSQEKKLEHQKFYDYYLGTQETKTDWNAAARIWFTNALQFKLRKLK